MFFVFPLRPHIRLFISLFGTAQCWEPCNRLLRQTILYCDFFPMGLCGVYNDGFFEISSDSFGIGDAIIPFVERYRIYGFIRILYEQKQWVCVEDKVLMKGVNVVVICGYFSLFKGNICFARPFHREVDFSSESPTSGFRIEYSMFSSSPIYVSALGSWRSSSREPKIW